MKNDTVKSIRIPGPNSVKDLTAKLLTLSKKPSSSLSIIFLGIPCFSARIAIYTTLTKNMIMVTGTCHNKTFNIFNTSINISVLNAKKEVRVLQTSILNFYSVNQFSPYSFSSSFAALKRAPVRNCL